MYQGLLCSVVTRGHTCQWPSVPGPADACFTGWWEAVELSRASPGSLPRGGVRAIPGRCSLPEKPELTVLGEPCPVS